MTERPSPPGHGAGGLERRPGYAGPLAILAFDHRSSFAELLGAPWPLPPDQLGLAGELKEFILEALTTAAVREPSLRGGAALIDEELGFEVARSTQACVIRTFRSPGV